MKFMRLESERLTYRKYCLSDFAVVFDWLGNAENMKYRRGGAKNELQTREYLTQAITNADAEECTDFEYAVERKSDGALIGQGTLMNLDSIPEIGWTLHRNYFRQGYGTEIGQTMLKLAFDILGLRRVTAGCMATNRASWRLMEKIGMRREACFVKAQFNVYSGEWVDRLQYAILREEWGALCKTSL
ncbi:MAG: GNAT family N-acetyltransferase [Oscillospiraceae bacterium]|jgi:RimJ/RimL family protein N-acetyltransferase|nr:GNAT family N-acetyltransferase [Oscillospiraceae bacterium]